MTNPVLETLGKATPRSRAEVLAYRRGYSAGCRKAHGYLARIMAAAKSWRDKAHRGYGDARCDRCEFWTRGHPGQVKWGTCYQPWEVAGGDLGRAWGDRPHGDASSGAVTSHENFACVNFRRRP
jgi:hypothetical protein